MRYCPKTNIKREAGRFDRLPFHVHSSEQIGCLFHGLLLRLQQSLKLRAIFRGSSLQRLHLTGQLSLLFGEAAQLIRDTAVDKEPEAKKEAAETKEEAAE